MRVIRSHKQSAVQHRVSETEAALVMLHDQELLAVDRSTFPPNYVYCFRPVKACLQLRQQLPTRHSPVLSAHPSRCTLAPACKTGAPSLLLNFGTLSLSCQKSTKRTQMGLSKRSLLCPWMQRTWCRTQLHLTNLSLHPSVHMNRTARRLSSDGYTLAPQRGILHARSYINTTSCTKQEATFVLVHRNTSNRVYYPDEILLDPPQENELARQHEPLHKLRQASCLFRSTFHSTG